MPAPVWRRRLVRYESLLHRERRLTPLAGWVILEHSCLVCVHPAAAVAARPADLALVVVQPAEPAVAVAQPADLAVAVVEPADPAVALPADPALALLADLAVAVAQLVDFAVAVVEPADPAVAEPTDLAVVVVEPADLAIAVAQPAVLAVAVVQPADLASVVEQPAHLLSSVQPTFLLPPAYDLLDCRVDSSVCPERDHPEPAHSARTVQSARAPSAVPLTEYSKIHIQNPSLGP